jgi:hypothetical protein
LVATVLDTITRLTDDTVALFDRALGRILRRAEIREQDVLIRDSRAINDKVRLLARLGAALIEARETGTDLQEAVASAVGWDKLARSVEEAKRLARPDKSDLSALAIRAWPVLHRLGPLFLGSLQFHAVPPAAATLRAVELLRSIYESGGRKWPSSLPRSFLRPVWREAVLAADGADRGIWEAATLLALRDRLRAGDIWVERSHQWRAVEDQLISPALFAAMREAGPLPIAVPAIAEEYLGLDYHVDIDGHYYSVPHRLIREQLDARITERTIELFCRGERVAVHLRAAVITRQSPSTCRAHTAATPSGRSSVSAPTPWQSGRAPPGSPR